MTNEERDAKLVREVYQELLALIVALRTLADVWRERIEKPTEKSHLN